MPCEQQLTQNLPQVHVFSDTMRVQSTSSTMRENSTILRDMYSTGTQLQQQQDMMNVSSIQNSSVNSMRASSVVNDGVGAADRLACPGKQTLMDVEDEITRKLREIEAMESELDVDAEIDRRLQENIERMKETSKHGRGKGIPKKGASGGGAGGMTAEGMKPTRSGGRDPTAMAGGRGPASMSGGSDPNSMKDPMNNESIIYEDDDDGAETMSLVSVGVRSDAVPAIPRVGHKPDKRYFAMSQKPDPTETCRNLLLNSVMPKAPLQEATFPPMPKYQLTRAPTLSHDPLDWRLLQSAQGY